MAAKNLIRLLCILLLLPVLSVFGSRAANASVTTGTIKGTTVDTGGLPIPGVLLTLESPAMMGVVQRETDADGRFLFPELTPGVYSLRVQLARDFGCTAFGRTGWWIGEPSADKTFGIICVP